MLSRLYVLASRVRAFFTQRSLDDDFERELATHLQLLTEENMGRGMTAHEARRAARLRLGAPAQLEEEHRDQRSLPVLETTVQDVRYSLRALARSPGFAAVAILTLALGIGVTTATFSIFHAVLLKPLPYSQPDRLVALSETNPLKGWTKSWVAPANYADWRKMNTVFTDTAAYLALGDKGVSGFDMFLSGQGEPQRLKAVAVSGNLFDVLGVSPMIGRRFTEQETYEGKNRVVILSYGLWKSLFNGDSTIIGRTITLTGRNWQVVGVMPPRFFFPANGVQLWAPLGMKPQAFVEHRRPHYLRAFGRLRPGVSIEQARDQMSAIARRLEETYPDTNTKMGVRLDNFHAWYSDDTRPALRIILAAVGLLFLIVCANIANLQLGRAVARTREITIRQALGASRRRLVRQLLTESLVLSVAAGVSGLALAAAIRAALAYFAPDAIPPIADLRLDASIIVANAAITLIAPFVFGLAPALIGVKAETLSDRSLSPARYSGMARNILVAAEVALSVVLVVGAGLLVRSLIRLQGVDPGFDPEHVVAFNISLPEVRYEKDEQVLRAVEDIDRRLHEMRGVVAAGATSQLALRGSRWTGDATVEGRGNGEYERELRHKEITPDFFRAMGTPLLAGRYLTEFDRGKPPVTLVNQALAKAYFHGDDPVGKRIKFGRPPDDEKKHPWVTIVGVVADEKQDGMAAPDVPEVYTPMMQEPSTDVTFVIRSNADLDSVIAAARGEVHAVDKDVALTDVMTLRELVHDSVNSERFRTSVLAAFAGIALCLAALGVYGVLAYAVTRRTREMGIRMALGARRSMLFGMILRQGMLPVLAGALIGLLGSIGITAMMRTLLFGVQPWDAATYTIAAAVLGAVAVGACAIPASRAVRVDPLVALRDE